MEVQFCPGWPLWLSCFEILKYYSSRVIISGCDIGMCWDVSVRQHGVASPKTALSFGSIGSAMALSFGTIGSATVLSFGTIGSATVLSCSSYSLFQITLSSLVTGISICFETHSIVWQMAEDSNLLECYALTTAGSHLIDVAEEWSIFTFSNKQL